MFFRPPPSPFRALDPARRAASGAWSSRMAALLAGFALCAITSVTYATPAHAGECEACPDVDVDHLVEVEAIPIERRSGMLLHGVPDYVLTHEHPCTVAEVSTPRIRLLGGYLALMAFGEVWNCPDSQSSSQISAEISKEHRTDWSQTGSVSGGFAVGVASVAARYSWTKGGSDSIREVTGLSQTLRAKECTRIPWLAYLYVGRYELKADFVMTRQIDWWTKNHATGHTVHHSGSYMQTCDTATAKWQRLAPMAWHLHLARRGCCGGQTPTKDLGFFPRLPPTTTPPVVPPQIDWPRQDTDEDPMRPVTPGHDEPTPPHEEEAPEVPHHEDPHQPTDPDHPVDPQDPHDAEDPVAPPTHEPVHPDDA